MTVSIWGELSDVDHELRHVDVGARLEVGHLGPGDVGAHPGALEAALHRPDAEHASPTLFEPLTIDLSHFPAPSSRGENKQKDVRMTHSRPLIHGWQHSLRLSPRTQLTAPNFVYN